MLKIISAPNPILSQKAKEVKKVDKSIHKFLKDLSTALLSARDPIGVGLAAPQVGRPLQIFIAKPTAKSKIHVFINPKIINKGVAKESVDGGRARLLDRRDGIPTARTDAKKEHWREGLLLTGPRISETGPAGSKEKSSTKLEGCLSLQNIWGEVKRAPIIKIYYMDENGKKYSKEFSGFLSTIIQHEIDHLQGILFPKRVLEQKGTLYKSHKNEKGEDVFEEIEI